MSKQIIAIGNTGGELVSSLNANFLELYRAKAISVADYGILPTASATDNTANLNTLLNGGYKYIYVPYIGNGSSICYYEINDTLLFDSYTAIVGAPGVAFKKVAAFMPLFMNRGSITKTFNTNILIDGFEVEDEVGIGASQYGLGALLGFYFIKNLTIKNYKCVKDAYSLGTMIAKFQHVIFDNITLTGEKTGINFINGHDALVTHYVAETFDDGGICAGALYPQFFPEIGDCYDITFKDCIDNKPVDFVDAGGQFIRLMGGSWADWQTGNTYTTGNYCLNAGHLYQCNNAAQYSGTGTVAPVHTSGSHTGADGIVWFYRQECDFYHTDIYNITFDNITIHRNKAVVYEAGGDPGFGMWRYPGTESLTRTYNISVINCKVTHPAGGNIFIKSDGRLENITLSNNTLDNVFYLYSNTRDDQVFDSTVKITLNGNTFKNVITGMSIRVTKDAEAVEIQSSGNVCIDCNLAFGATNGSTIRFNGIDLPLRSGQHSNLTPVIGDLIRMADNYLIENSLYVYKAGGWVNLAV